jgi:hypothetical protein
LQCYQALAIIYNITNEVKKVKKLSVVPSMRNEYNVVNDNGALLAIVEASTIREAKNVAQKMFKTCKVESDDIYA